MTVFAKIGLGLAGLAVSAIALADPVGTWRTIDDQTGKAKSEVEIFKVGDEYKGRIKKVYSGNVCTTCEGRFENRNLAGEIVLWGVRSTGGNSYGGGGIVDPKTGKNYRVKMTDNGSTLTVRGYVGISLLGRNQTWQRL